MLLIHHSISLSVLKKWISSAKNEEVKLSLGVYGKGLEQPP